MRSRLTYSIAVLSLLGFASCTTSVEEDVAEYCNCVENVQDGFDMAKCVKLANEMQEKYSFDPGAADYIQENIGDCKRVMGDE